MYVWGIVREDTVSTSAPNKKFLDETPNVFDLQLYKTPVAIISYHQLTETNKLSSTYLLLYQCSLYCQIGTPKAV